MAAKDEMDLEEEPPLPRIPTDEELHMVPSSTPDKPHDIHYKRYGFPDGVSGVNCLFCNTTVRFPLDHNLQADARAAFSVIPCIRGYIWGRPVLGSSGVVQ